MNEKSPIEKLNPDRVWWWRFNSLPFDVQQRLVDLILLVENSFFPIPLAFVETKLANLYSLTDAEIIRLDKEWLKIQEDS